MHQIPPFTTAEETKLLKKEIMQEIERVIDSGQFILGPDVKNLEKEVAEYLNVKYAIGLNSGTDALIIALRALDIQEGDEVIVPSFTFFATAEAVEHVGATPVFIDVDESTYNIDISLMENLITKKTKAIIPVHLFGHAVNMDPLMEIANNYNLIVIEDVAQAFGGEYKGQKTGSIGHIGCFSFFPTKNLGAYGDGGLIVTDDEEIYEMASMLRAHGSKKKYHNELVGYNSRLDSIQAAILRVKLNSIEEWNEGRRRVDQQYKELLSDLDGIILPTEMGGTKHVYHQFTIRVLNGKRDKLQAYLKEQGIGTMVYYPTPVHKLPLYNSSIKLPISEMLADEVLSLPMYPHLSIDEINKIGHIIKRFL
ncbi:dTDP-4-amino-4,6-dideoxygalactose transaminase [Alkalibacillus filiformis]|uniref:dTDP-4-amino-4,6-dideoxygalactose transaminase n=1 Tax=Alkalibacillus filiformis TaxID=200990 RepID=A0ABU0DWC6_9BACI|nr:DegT/DnrJ/EryC1/StrS family aminotransferase [Alkalibacillus filiformis]MDQ0352761.1 dTDP-4-amino-4,6-dideoxygalactose transaminase [Alkalibacillus filiformis]